MNSIRFIFLLLLKSLGHVIYPSKLNWISKQEESWDDVSLILILNHTSLFEFVYGVTLPTPFLKSLSERLVIPVADKTMNKKISGFIFRNLAPKTISLTRKRDQSWEKFLSAIDINDICIFMPEGQMKRKNGLDKNGNPMKVKTGVYDLMKKFSGKKAAIVYSHGLHHVFAPGDAFPKIFKKVEAHVELVDVDSFLKQYGNTETPAKSVAQELQLRRDKYLS